MNLESEQNTKEITETILSNFDNSFIYHVSEAGWGTSIFIMGKNGISFCRLYWYNDDNTTVYLDWLSVSEGSRRQGLGTLLQKIREEIGRRLGTTYSCLWVKKNTWMYDWYSRRGYEYYADYEQENAVWLRKLLIKKGCANA